MANVPKQIHLTAYTNPIFHIVCKVLKLSGLWHPYNGKLQEKIAYKIYGVAYQITFLICFTFSLLVDAINIQQISDLTSRLTMLTAEIALISKVILVFFANQTIQQIKQNIDNVTLSTESEKKLTRPHIRIMWMVLINMGSGPQLSMFGWSISSILSNERQLAYAGWYPGFDWHHSTRDYWLIQMYQYVASSVTASFNIAIDLFYCFAMYAMSIELKILGERFATMQPLNSVPSAKMCLIEHIKSLEMAKSSIALIKYCLSWSYLLQMLTSVLCICSVTNEMAKVFTTFFNGNQFFFVFLFKAIVLIIF